MLFLTHSQDFYVPEIIQSCLAYRGIEMIRMNTDEFPLKVGLNAYQINGEAKGELVLDNQIHAFSSFDAVIFRKNMKSNLMSELEGDVLIQATREATAAKNAIIYACEAAFWMDSPFDILRAENKQLQLITAQKVGLNIPNSALTNQPDVAKLFYHQQEKKIISKMLTPLTNFMKSARSFVYTSQVTEAHLDSLDSLKLCPMQFQQEIEKEYELRVVYVDGKCFAGKIATSAIVDSQTPDWRKAGEQDFSWQKYQLPADISELIDKLMKQLLLKFGALDLIKSTDGEYVFLEVNPCGEWGMLQKELGLPIAEHIANCIYNNITEGKTHVA